MHDTADILNKRLHRQLIEPAEGSAYLDPAGVVEHLGAMQAQDYAGSLWSVGVRCAPGTTAADVEAAIAERRIVRTWPMRGTLHLLAPADVRWMLALLTPRITSRATKRHEQLGLTEADFDLARKLFTEALSGERQLSRPEAMALLEANGVHTDEQRGYHILWVLAQEALICCGPMTDKQQTFVLLDEWVPPGTSQQDSPTAEQALARLAEKYFTARGPATVADFAWWAGITKGDARDGLDAIIHRLEMVTVHGVEYWLVADSDDDGVLETPRVHLLPGFDEYMLGYTDRSIQLGERKRDYGSTVSANGMFASTLVIDGLVAGTWRRTLKKDHVEIVVTPFHKLNRAELAALEQAAEQYGRFKELPAVVELATG
jgi:hypothetical protein